MGDSVDDHQSSANFKDHLIAADTEPALRLQADQLFHVACQIGEHAVDLFADFYPLSLGHPLEILFGPIVHDDPFYLHAKGDGVASAPDSNKDEG